MKRMQLEVQDSKLVAPELDVLLHLSKPDVECAGIVFNNDSIEVYHTLDGQLKCETCSRRGTDDTPVTAMRRILSSIGIGSGEEEDGPGLYGKLVNLTQPSSARSLRDVCKKLRIKGNTVAHTMYDVTLLVTRHYNGNHWLS